MINKIDLINDETKLEALFNAWKETFSGLRPKEAPLNMLLAMASTALLCVGIGIYPTALYSILPYPVDYIPYTTSHVITQLQLLFFSALAFTFLMLSGLYPPELKSTNLDFDWIYRRLIPQFTFFLKSKITEIDRFARKFLFIWINHFLRLVDRYYGADSVLARTLPVGNMVLWAVTLLGLFLVLYLTG